MATPQALKVYDGDTVVKYTRPGSEVSPGSVQIVGTIAGVDVTGGPASVLGALDISSVFDVVKIGEQAITVGASVYWNATADPIGGVAESGAAGVTVEDTLLGICVLAAGEDDARVRVHLQQAEVPTS